MGSFEEFVGARRAALLRTAFLLTGNVADAEDLVQVALIKAVPMWGRIAERPEPYVRRILAREAVTRWRARRWRELGTAEVPDAPSSDPDHARRLTVRASLMALPPRQRTVVVLRFYEDLTERETAFALGISVGTVKSQVHAALAALRTRLPGLVDVLA
jgi:RNA polymerase sigma-70 factor (sigma-E family)